jgi:uncharacterized membrane protein
MRHYPSAEQLLFFSDAVIAITITLLMLEIRLPVEPGELTDAALLAALGQIWPQFLAYFISFAVIAQFWISHHGKLHYVVRTDGGLVWLEFLFLFTIGLIPFSTGVISQNGGTIGTVFYALTIVGAALSLTLLGAYASARGLTDLAPGAFAGTLFPSLMPAAVFMLSVPLAFYDADLAKYSWLLIIPLGFLGRFVASDRQEPS